MWIKSGTNLKRVALCSLLTASCFAISGAKEPFYIYREFHHRDNHYAPSGWMGDYGDLRVDDHYKPAGSTKVKTVIKVSYTGQARQNNGWAGVYWQHPANNWGSKPGGYNLNGMKKLIFMARGEKGGERLEEFKVGGLSGDYADSGTASIGPITLVRDWREYEIPLDGQELSSITGGFAWTISREANPDGAVFYLDNVRFE